MTDDNPTSSHANDDPGSDGSTELPLSGLTEAIGGLDPALPDHDPIKGTLVGGVRIIRLIAEGGMGRVYEGLQEKPRRPVAVKVMRPGFVSREACRRFDNESEVLGRLRHPYIAQIYSAGICTIVGAQVPYFVMEFIPDALPITKYVRENKLSTNERVELFRKVCEAVAHGHENNIIHRDLKPSNILVEPSGIPKIIDFGVARCVDASTEALTALTDVGQLIGTVQYMSPEQFSANPLNVDVRADVYALGVILYEILTGRPPYEIRQKEIFDAARVVREFRPVSPVEYDPALSIDVVRITDTCLQKDQRRRYANATELTNALAACLVGIAVQHHDRGRLNAALAKFRDRVASIPVFFNVGLASVSVALVLACLSWLVWPDPLAPASATKNPASYRFNGHTYRVFLEPVSRAEAVRRCQEQGGHLARITTESENKKVLAAAAQAGPRECRLWIDGTCGDGASQWEYGDISKVSFFYRGRGRLVEVEPDATGRSLAVVVDAPLAYWAALGDESRADGFVCEWNQ